MTAYIDAYSWLKQEILDIKTQKFHVFEKPMGDQFIYQIKDYKILPPSYLEFISCFGGAKLYRVSNHYNIGIQFQPKEFFLRNEEKILEFGFFDENNVYFRSLELRENFEAPIYQLSNNHLKKAGDNFTEWLIESCRKDRSSYKKSEWKEILEGPSPFTQKELKIVEERRKFDWKIIGYDENDVVFCVKNKSSLSLPFLTLGVVAKDKSFEGAVRLDVSSIRPNHEALIKRDVYKDITAPDKLDIYSLPDPIPEDRKRYWEFRESHT